MTTVLTVRHFDYKPIFNKLEVKSMKMTYNSNKKNIFD